MESEKFFNVPKKITESVTEKESKEKSDPSISNWVKVSQERFNLIKQIIDKNKDLGTAINNKKYTLNDANDLVNKIAIKKIGKDKAIDFYNNNLIKKAERILELRPTSSRQQMLEVLNYLGEIFNGPKIDDEQPYTTNISELESEDSAKQEKNNQAHGLKILTSNQMLSRLPISLAQLKAGNNPKKLKNEIRQILYSLYRSKKLTKHIYKNLVDII